MCIGNRIPFSTNQCTRNKKRNWTCYEDERSKDDGMPHKRNANLGIRKNQEAFVGTSDLERTLSSTSRGKLVDGSEPCANKATSNIESSRRDLCHQQGGNQAFQVLSPMTTWTRGWWVWTTGGTWVKGRKGKEELLKLTKIYFGTDSDDR